MKKIIFASAGLLALAVASAVAQPAPGNNSPWNPTWALPNDSPKWTYSAAATQAPASTATDIFTLCGSATRTIRVTNVTVAGRATTAASIDVALVKRSTANSGGTSSSVTRVPLDSSFGTVSATALQYSANPTTGTAVGTARVMQVFLGNLTTGQPGPTAKWEFGSRPGSAMVLRGTAQCLAVNLESQSASGGLIDINTEWTEE